MWPPLRARRGKLDDMKHDCIVLDRTAAYQPPLLVRADQYFKMKCLLGWQLYCHPRKTSAIQGWQYNCHPNIVEN